MSGQVTPIQIKLLRLLTKTGFATNRNIAEMGIIKLNQSNSHLTKRLLSGGYIGRVYVSADFGTGRKVMYFITKKGANIVAETDNIQLSELAFTTHSGGIKKAHIDGETSLIRTDFKHKEEYISLFISLEKYLENTDFLLDRFCHYYKLKGIHSTTLTVNKKNFQTDGIFFCEHTNPKKPPFIYLAEIHRHSDRRHIIKQLLQHVQAIEEGSFAKRFNIETPYFVLSVFTDRNVNLVQSVITELQTYDEWEIIKDYFLFGKLEDLQQDFYKNFYYFGGEKKPLPPKI